MVDQLARSSDFHSEGCGFESRPRHHSAMAQLVAHGVLISGVLGSNPSGGTTVYPRARAMACAHDRRRDHEAGRANVGADGRSRGHSFYEAPRHGWARGFLKHSIRTYNHGGPSHAVTDGAPRGEAGGVATASAPRPCPAYRVRGGVIGLPAFKQGWSGSTEGRAGDRNDW